MYSIRWESFLKVSFESVHASTYMVVGLLHVLELVGHPIEEYGDGLEPDSGDLLPPGMGVLSADAARVEERLVAPSHLEEVVQRSGGSAQGAPTQQHRQR